MVQSQRGKYCRYLPDRHEMTTLKTLNNTDKKERLRLALCDRIITMQLLPGATIDEIELESEFGVSRSPIREIIRQLASEGYIELEQNRSPRVAPMDYSSVRMFFQAAPLIYIATTKLAAVSPSVADIDTLRCIQTAFRTAMDSGDTTERMLLNNRFHLHIGEMANNIYLMPSLKRLLIDHARLSMTFYRISESDNDAEDSHKAAEQHDLIIDAIEQRKPDLAAELIQAHWELSKKRMTDFVMPQNLDIAMPF